MLLWICKAVRRNWALDICMVKTVIYLSINKFSSACCSDVSENGSTISNLTCSDAQSRIEQMCKLNEKLFTYFR